MRSSAGQSGRAFSAIRPVSSAPSTSPEKNSASIKKLNQAELKKRVGRYLTAGQIERMLQRRDAILALAAKRVAELGEAAVIYP